MVGRPFRQQALEEQQEKQPRGAQCAEGEEAQGIGGRRHLPVGTDAHEREETPLDRPQQGIEKVRSPANTRISWLVEYAPYVIADPRECGIHPDPEDPEFDLAGREIPCFRIYPEDHPEKYIGQTSEDLPHDVQEKAAHLMAAAPTLYAALEHFFNIMHDYESSVEKGYVQQAMKQAEAAIESATGRPA